MMGGKNRCPYGGCASNHDHCAQPTISDGTPRCPNWLGRENGRDGFTGWCGKARRLPGQQRERSVSLQRHNMHAALGAKNQPVSVKRPPDRSGGIVHAVGRCRYDVVTRAHGEVGRLGKRLESDGPKAQLSLVARIVFESHPRERGNFELASPVDRQCC